LLGRAKARWRQEKLQTVREPAVGHCLQFMLDLDMRETAISDLAADTKTVVHRAPSLEIRALAVQRSGIHQFTNGRFWTQVIYRAIR
jgi:hypothetical protein